jgi:hypothetical protein
VAEERRPPKRHKSADLRKSTTAPAWIDNDAGDALVFCHGGIEITRLARVRSKQYATMGSSSLTGSVRSRLRRPSSLGLTMECRRSR